MRKTATKVNKILHVHNVPSTLICNCRETMLRKVNINSDYFIVLEKV